MNLFFYLKLKINNVSIKQIKVASFLQIGFRMYSDKTSSLTGLSSGEGGHCPLRLTRHPCLILECWIWWYLSINITESAKCRGWEFKDLPRNRAIFRRSDNMSKAKSRLGIQGVCQGAHVGARPPWEGYAIYRRGPHLWNDFIW